MDNDIREELLSLMREEVNNLPEIDADGGTTIEYVIAEHTFESRQIGIEEFCTAKVQERKTLANGSFHISSCGTVHADIYNGEVVEDSVWIEQDD